MKTLDFRPFQNSLSGLRFLSENATRIPNGFEDDDKNLIACLDPFMVDSAKLTECKAMRRLLRKAQVYCMPGSPHIRTRKAHTDEVATLARIIGQILGLNSELCYSAALGHDIGHTPFGHLGERAIKKLTGVNFRHEIFSAILARFIERKGQGLNLTEQTLEGILNHSSGEGGIVLNASLLQESRVVKLADKIAYLFADMNDAIRFYRICSEDLPPEVWTLGSNQRERIMSCVYALIKESANRGFVSFELCEEAKIFVGLRKWMFDNVYSKVDDDYLQKQLDKAFVYVSTEPEFAGCDPVISFACLTDTEVDLISQYRMETLYKMMFLGVLEMVPYLRGLKYTELVAKL